MSARAWAIRATLLASTLALLGTSQSPRPDQSSKQATYEFRRSVEGEALELTREQPSGGFLVTVRALDLGPEDVVSTGEAEVTVIATVTTTDIAGDPPATTLRFGQETPEPFREMLSVARPLSFQGTCEKPAANAPCQASFDVAFSRDDDGLAGGVVRVEWSFEMTSRGHVESSTEATHEAEEPPWTVEVTPQ